VSLFAVTHHVYLSLMPSDFAGSTEALADRLDSPLAEIAWYTQLAQRYAPGSQVWAGENGPIGGGDDGTCGKATICGKYGSAVWYADDMGLRSKYGFVQHNRQDLFGGAYGLVNSASMAMALGAVEPVAIKPDFWINFIWKRALGASVHNATASSRDVRAYAFSGAPPSPFAEPACSGAPLQLLLINLRNATAAVALPPAAGVTSYSLWALAPSDGTPMSTTATLNGVALPAVLDVSKGNPDFLRRIAAPAATGSVAAPLSLPPLATAFVCYCAQ
jgi:hypothetical protein